MIINSKEDYIYDPKHVKNPGGGYTKTDKGWTLNTELKEKEFPNREIDITQKDNVSEGQFISEKQLMDEDVVSFVGKDGKVKSSKIKDLDEEERKEIFETIKTCKLIHAKGFSDYSKVDLNTFNKNKDNILNFIEDKRIVLGKNSRETPVSKRIDGFLEENRENLDRITIKYANGVRSPIARKAIEEYKNKLQDVIKEACSFGGGMENITEKDLDEYLQEDMKRLIFQELETRRRSMGDHGIRHLVGNAINSVDILNKLQEGGIGSRNIDGTFNGKKITGKDKLLAMTTMVNHDIGYTLGQVALNAAKGGFHKSYSGQIALEESGRYSKVFGNEGMEKMVGKPEVYKNGKPVLKREVDMVRDNQQIYETGKKDNNGKDILTNNIKEAKGYAEGKPKKASEWKAYTQEEVYNNDGERKITEEEYQNCKITHQKGFEGVIQYHDSSNYDWKNDPVGSSIALADCTALFGKDKVQEFFYKNDNAMKEITKMQCIMNASNISNEDKQQLFSGFKKKMYKMINNLSDATVMDKDLLQSQIKEMEVGKFSTVDDILTRSSGLLEGFQYDKENNQVVVNTSYSEEGNILENMFGSDMARNQWSKLYKDIKGSGRITVEQDGSQTLYRGNKNDNGESKILVRINDFSGGKFSSNGVAEVYHKIRSYPVKQMLARYSESISQMKNTGNDFDSVLKEFDKFDKTLNEKVSKEKTKGEIIFGSNWEKIKELMKEVRNGKNVSKELKNIGLSEEELAYLTGGFKNASIKRIVNKIAKEEFVKNMALKISEDLIRRYETSVGDVDIVYETNGELGFVYKGHYYVVNVNLNKNKIEKFIKEHNKEIKLINNEESLKSFLSKSFKKFRRLF